MHIKTYISVMFLFCVFFAPLSHAQTEADKQALLKAWEDNQRAQPTTKLFQKTKDQGIYLFETTLFPYKGKVVVHNTLISNEFGYYGDYDAREASDKIGVIEAELIDAPERFTKTLYRSISVWENQSTMYYFNDTKQWMTAAQWKASRDTISYSKDTQYETSNSNIKILKRYATPVTAVILMIIFLFILGQRTDKFQKAHAEKFDLSMQRQKEAIDQQKEIHKRSEKSLELLKEQNELLKQILAKKE